MNGLLALAFGAGMLAPINPCGFAVLPAFLAYSIDADSGRGDPRTGVAERLAGGLRAGLALTAGFAGTLTAVGLLLAVGMRSLISAVPWLALVFGAILGVLGLAMFLGAHLPVRLPGRRAGVPVHGRLSMIAFGAGYALASAACSVALLLAVVTQALATTNLSGVLVVFAAYAAGSATLLLTFALFAAFASTAITRYLRPLLAHMHQITGAVLAASGGYLLVYWIPRLTGKGQSRSNPLDRVAQVMSVWITAHQGLIVLVAAVLSVAAVAALFVSRRAHASPNDGCPPPHPPADMDRNTEDHTR